MINERQGSAWWWRPNTSCIKTIYLYPTTDLFALRLSTEFKGCFEVIRRLMINVVQILLALRAIGNAGQTTVPNTLAACASESGNDMETRIAAIQAFRRMPCSIDVSSFSG